jgi:hypothetical protein
MKNVDAELLKFTRETRKAGREIEQDRERLHSGFGNEENGILMANGCYMPILGLGT